MHQPRISMFAGPNGSRKSTIKDYLTVQQIGAYLNADELEKVLFRTHILDLKEYHPDLCAVALVDFLYQKSKKKDHQVVPLLERNPTIKGQSIIFQRQEVDSYLAARIIDFIRLEFLRLKISFTFETVMSHISKVEFLHDAKRYGFKTYLYYVATVDPEINIGRVHYRVKMGGHPVPEQKIRERYYRSLDLLMQAVDHADRAYIFDNSSHGEKASFLAEIEHAEVVKLDPIVGRLPKWSVDRVLTEFT